MNIFQNLIDVDERDLINTNSKTILPVGVHKFFIENVEERENSKKNGAYLLVTYVFEGDLETRINDYLNHANPSNRAVKIAAHRFNEICKAIGVLRSDVKSESDLMGKKICLTLGVEDYSYIKNDTGEKIDAKRNFIKGYLPYKNTKPEEPSGVNSSGNNPDWLS